MNIQEKVQQLKSSFTVEGTPLFKSNRFTEEEIESLKKESTCHSSHWFGFEKNAKIWTDEEIATQIEVFLLTPSINEATFDKAIDLMYKSVALNDKVVEKETFKKLLFLMLNWTEEKNGISKLWGKFSSAPLRQDGFHRNEKLEKYAKLYGALSMAEIFDGQFSDKFYIFWHGANQALQNFDSMWDEEKRKKDLSESVFKSRFKNLEDIEENVVIKKIEEEAKKFYLDKTKDFEERVKVFTKYARKNDSIFEPSDSNLKKIFNVYSENDWIERHSFIDTVVIVGFWLSYLKKNRCELDWSNKYHPKVKQAKRNYIPSDESIDRLRKYYIEKLFLEGVGSFEFDW